MWILDTECYSNVWLLCMQHKDSGERRQYLLPDLTESQRDEIKTLMRTQYTVGFNSLSYDLPMIAAAIIDEYDTQQLKDLSDKLILSEQPSWLVCNNEGISVPELWTKRHVDLIEIAIGQASLKIYGGRLNCNTMQDLPLDPSQPVPENKISELIAYCFNDISVTQLLLNHLWKRVQLRD